MKYCWISVLTKLWRQGYYLLNTEYFFAPLFVNIKEYIYSHTIFEMDFIHFFFTDVVNLITSLVREKFETECELCQGKKNKIACTIYLYPVDSNLWQIEDILYNMKCIINLFFKTYFSVSRQSQISLGLSSYCLNFLE